MCETLQLNWKLPNPLKPLSNSAIINNNNTTDLKKKLVSSRQGTKHNVGGRPKKSDDKYGLRACSIKKRIEVEGRKGQPKKRGPKPRPRPQPMSKYRRKTANLRERVRMGEINTAFDKLREKIPTPIATNKSRCEKLTKINILHVAINYIKALESILDTGDAGVQVYGTSIVRSPFDTQSNHEYYDDDVPVQNPMGGKKRLQTRTSLSEANRRKKKPSTSSSLSHSGSEDSGIADGDMEHDGDGDDEDDEEPDFKVECPDWTELTSTLEFPLQPQIKPSNLKLTLKANMDTLLSTAASHIGGFLPVQMNVGGEGTFLETKRNVLQPIKLNPNRQTSFTDLGGPDSSDILGDLNVLEGSLDDGFGGINFVHEDPFQIFI